MGFVTTSFKLSYALHDASETRWKSLGYPSRGAYLKGLLRQDLLHQPAHHTGLLITALPPLARDAIDEKLSNPDALPALRQSFRAS